MSRWINYDALMNRLDICVKTGMGSTIAFTFKHIVDDTPSIELITCRECIFADKDDKAEIYRCRDASFPWWNSGEYFCSHGLKKGDDDE